MTRAGAAGARVAAATVSGRVGRRWSARSRRVVARLQSSSSMACSASAWRSVPLRTAERRAGSEGRRHRHRCPGDGRGLVVAGQRLLHRAGRPRGGHPAFRRVQAPERPSRLHLAHAVSGRDSRAGQRPAVAPDRGRLSQQCEEQGAERVADAVAGPEHRRHAVCGAVPLSDPVAWLFNNNPGAGARRNHPPGVPRPPCARPSVAIASTRCSTKRRRRSPRMPKS
jgi:hypothetical protein